jgi:hypothetical protein
MKAASPKLAQFDLRSRNRKPTCNGSVSILAPLCAGKEKTECSFHFSSFLFPRFLFLASPQSCSGCRFPPTTDLPTVCQPAKPSDKINTVVVDRPSPKQTSELLPQLAWYFSLHNLSLCPRYPGPLSATSLFYRPIPDAT